jgi:hypothetical protein
MQRIVMALSIVVVCTSPVSVKADRADPAPARPSEAFNEYPIQMPEI